MFFDILVGILKKPHTLTILYRKVRNTASSPALQVVSTVSLLLRFPLPYPGLSHVCNISTNSIMTGFSYRTSSRVWRQGPCFQARWRTSSSAGPDPGIDHQNSERYCIDWPRNKEETIYFEGRNTRRKTEKSLEEKERTTSDYFLFSPMCTFVNPCISFGSFWPFSHCDPLMCCNDFTSYKIKWSIFF